MPSKSASQQRFFGMVDAYKKGELDNPSPEIKKAADSMTRKEVRKFAKTKHKGLPEHVKKSKNESVEILNTIIDSCVKNVLNEAIINESFKSQKLANFARQHGGIDTKQTRDIGGIVADFYNMSDEDFDNFVAVDEDEYWSIFDKDIKEKRFQYPNHHYRPIIFNDGTFLIRKNPNEDLPTEKPYRDKRWNRRINTNIEKDGKYYYQPVNKFVDRNTYRAGRGGKKIRKAWGYPNSVDELAESVMRQIRSKLLK